MSRSSAFALRAAMAFGLLVGFYLLAMIIAGGLFYLIYLRVALGIHIPGRLLVGALIAGVTILWAIIPRRDRFVPPGPALDSSAHPELFEVLQGVARDTEQTMPSEVYLVPDVNAWVSQRGGLLGFGGRRVMGLGLPLLQGLTVQQMRAVIAHEFGHYHGGDTKLGPVLYRTRSAMGRALQGLDDSWLQHPFRWYSTMFLRITHATSRQQEYEADALASRLYGKTAMTNGLKALPGMSEAFPAYWHSEVVPVLQSGFAPPIASGFSRFLEHPSIATQVDQVREVALGESAGNPYDTHPSLPDRIAALVYLPEAQQMEDDDRAITLLSDVPALERELLEKMFGPKALEPVGWEESGEKVVIPGYKGQLGLQRSALAGVTGRRVLEIVRDPAIVSDNLNIRSDQEVNEEDRREYALHLIAAAIAVALHDAGWKINAHPGAAVTLRRGDQRVEPFVLLGQLREGDVSADDWESSPALAEIADVDLGTLGKSVEG